MRRAALGLLLAGCLGRGAGDTGAEGPPSLERVWAGECDLPVYGDSYDVRAQLAIEIEDQDADGALEGRALVDVVFIAYDSWPALYYPEGDVEGSLDGDQVELAVDLGEDGALGVAVELKNDKAMRGMCELGGFEGELRLRWCRGTLDGCSPRVIRGR